MVRFLVVLLVFAIYLISGCQTQESQDLDVTFIPIDKIKVGESNGNGTEINASNDSGSVPKVVANVSMNVSVKANASMAVNVTAPAVNVSVPDTASKAIAIIVDETDLVNIKPVAKDPDSDELKHTFSLPLNSSGQWQTKYGDNGEYTLTITTSDGELTSTRDALLIVNKKEEAPILSSAHPNSTALTIMENSKLEFRAEAYDLNNDTLSYSWKLDGKQISSSKLFDFDADYSSAGSHTVKLDVSDGITGISKLWSLTITNVDRSPVLKVMRDITVKETETVTLKPDASDTDGDKISYIISDPIGDDGIWETSYDDAGIYSINVTASDGEMADTQVIKVTVINVNRPPVIDDIVQVK
ncbi:hypothetical protein J4401_07205 [Candidatus Woesearchaeota archaeon]|nr:hypothetical protein [Candidatus Woesearchaeota archaeon]